MKWTTELPGEEGWYWMQRGEKTEVVRIAILGCDMDPWQKPMLHIYSPSLPASAPVTRAEFSKAKWSGPITPPSDEPLRSGELMTAQMEAQRLRNGLKEAVKDLRRIAQPVGPMHPLWDDIFEYEMLINGRGDTAFDWDGPDGPKPRPTGS